MAKKKLPAFMMKGKKGKHAEGSPYEEAHESMAERRAEGEADEDGDVKRKRGKKGDGEGGSAKGLRGRRGGY